VTAAATASPAVEPVPLAPPFVAPPKPEPVLVTPATTGGPTKAGPLPKPAAIGKTNQPAKPYSPSSL